MMPLIITHKFHLKLIPPYFRSLSNYLIQTSLQVAIVIAQYFAYAQDRATTLCFLLFQDTKLPLTNTQYLM